MEDVEEMPQMRMFVTLNGVEGKAGVPAVSGGDVRLMEILNRRSKGTSVQFSTSPMGVKLARAYDVDVDFSAIKISERYGIIGNLERVLASLLCLPKGKVDIVYSSGEHLYDVLPAAVAHWLQGAPWVALVHWVEDYPWENKRGNTPALHRYLYWLNRVLAMALIKLGAKHILAVSASTREKLIAKRNIDPARISEVWCGLDLPWALSIREMRQAKAPTYDATFMKRLNYGKGIFDLVDIWECVVAKRPHARLQIIGDGPPGVVQELAGVIERRGLSANIDVVGVVHDKHEKAARLADSRIFILPSHEENWAIVIGEALAAGLPVIAYDLPEIRPLWGDRVEWVPLGDTNAFAAAVLDAVERKGSPPLDAFLRSLDWNEIARKEYAIIAATLRKTGKYKTGLPSDHGAARGTD